MSQIANGDCVPVDVDFVSLIGGKGATLQTVKHKVFADCANKAVQRIHHFVISKVADITNFNLLMHNASFWANALLQT